MSIRDRAEQPSRFMTNAYLALVCAGGAYVLYRSVLVFAQQMRTMDHLPAFLLEAAVLLLISVLCRSFPVHIGANQGLDVSIIPLLAAVALKGAPYASVMVVFTYLASIEQHPKTKKAVTFFNQPLIKSLFNMSLMVLSLHGGAYAFALLGGQVGDLSLPGALLPVLGFIVVCYLVNGTFIALLMRLLYGMSLKLIFRRSVLAFIPNLLATAPIGYFLAYFFTTDGGPYAAILFFLPLILARYAFKLYSDSREQFMRTLQALSVAIEAKDEYTEGHSQRVGEYCEKIAAQMGLNNARIENLRIGAALHDIGKIGIRDNVLTKPGHLTDEEWMQMRTHPEIGARILDAVEKAPVVDDCIIYHHTYYNNSGYPKRDTAADLPLEVYILSLADAYDAMTSDRPYRPAMDHQTASAIIAAERGGQFHPLVVDAFFALPPLCEPVEP